MDENKNTDEIPRSRPPKFRADIQGRLPPRPDLQDADIKDRLTRPSSHRLSCHVISHRDIYMGTVRGVQPATLTGTGSEEGIATNISGSSSRTKGPPAPPEGEEPSEGVRGEGVH